MKKLLLCFYFIWLITTLSAQEQKPRKNLVFSELAGAVVAGIGLGYERYFLSDSKWKGTARMGAGLIDQFTTPSYFFGSSLIYGSRSSVEFGFNYLINYDERTFESTETSERFGNGSQWIVAYRYQNWENGWFFRFAYVIPIACCGSFIPVYSGLSVGYAF